MKNKYIRLAQNLASDMKQLNINAYAASSAFFLFVSLVPVISLLCALIPFTNLTEEFMIDLVTDVAPDLFDAFVSGIVTQAYDATGGTVTVAVVILIWTASKSVMALVQGLNVVNEVQEKRNYFHIRIVCSFYMVIMVVAIGFSLVFMVFGKSILDGTAAILPARFHSVTDMVSDVLMRPRALYSIFILTLVFGAFYAYLPNKKLTYREQLPGAMIVAIAWTVFSYFFSIYAQYSASLSMYGSMSILVIAMLWMYGCMYMLLVGAYLNRYFRPVTKVLVHPKAVGKRHG